MTDLPIDTWVDANNFRQNHLDLTTCMSVVFYHVRSPVMKVELIDGVFGGQRNELTHIFPGQVSLIAGFQFDYFMMVTFKDQNQWSSIVSAYEYSRYPASYVRRWALSASDLLMGNSKWQIFNGPMPINIRQTKVGGASS